MAILDLEILNNTPLERDPFDFVVAKGMMRPDNVAALNHDYPEIDIPANFPPEKLTYGPSFKQLLAELDGPEFEAAIENKFNIDLEYTTRTITVRKYSEMSDGTIHTDHWSKVLTVLVYFHNEWDQEYGKLRFLRSIDDIDNYVAEVAPLAGTLVAFRRSRNSFHGYKRFSGERRMVQLSWVRSGKLAWYAQQLARFSTHTVKRLSRLGH